MLTFEDCLAFCELTEEEIDAIAEHEHVPEMLAVELGNYLVHEDDGVPRISRILVEDIAAAEHRGDRDRVLRLKLVLKHFVDAHPSTTL